MEQNAEKPDGDILVIADNFLQWNYLSQFARIVGMKNIYYALAYYSINPVADPHEEIALHKAFFSKRDATCRIYISEEGINGQMSACISDAEDYMNWLRSRPVFSTIRFKIHEITENIFPRITIKYRKQIVALDHQVDWSLRGEHISPKEWRNKLSEGNCLLIDVRNNYEWKIGHFENALLPNLKTFREFPEYTDQLAKKYDPETPIMMYCTGGIRCEFYSALMIEKGFKTVYQLDGGVIAYGQAVGQDFWKGKLFVFDDRLAISITGEEVSPISICKHCALSTDTYYNCANINCNEFFVACSACVNLYSCCCSDDCRHSGTVRAYNPLRGNKPFRRKSCRLSETTDCSI